MTSPPPKGTIKRDHVREAARLWREKPGRGGFRASTTYDVLVDRGRYPPKAICALAYELATDSELKPHDFPGAFDGPWHQVLTGLKFKIVPKGSKQDSTRVPRKPAKLLDRGTGTGDDAEDFPEGADRYEMHRSKERSRSLIKKAKRLRLERTGKLECEACLFDFAKRYGPEGLEYIEGHHTVPVSTLTAKTRTRIEQIALVCANCHRMLHLLNPLPSVAELRERIRDCAVKGGGRQYRSASQL